jgi:molybdate-binding protein
MPYRSAWGLLQDMERVLGGPLVRLQRGRGAALTTDGATLLRADETARRRLARQLESMAVEIGPPVARNRGDGAPVLRIAASHDPALVALQDAIPAAAGVKLQIEFCGSLHALSRFRSGEVDVAGFHFVPGLTATMRPYLSDLRPSRDRLLRFVDREQGLIVARGKRQRIRSLADVVRRRLRFVNRQPGSGTRLLIDAQLSSAGHEPGDVRGYDSVEFTHSAVAATIASGRADVGIGVAAAAAEFDLGFVPVAREQYWFAVREAMLRAAPIVALRSWLTGPTFQELVGRMNGYDATHTGELVRVDGIRSRSLASKPGMK